MKKYYYNESIFNEVLTIIICFSLILFTTFYTITIVKDFVFIITFAIMNIFFIIIITKVLKELKKNVNFVKEKKKCLKNGIVYDGIIIHVHKSTVGIRHHGDGVRTYFSFEVKFVIGNEEHILITPEIIFNPNKLKSNNVRIYILDNMFYVCDYNL